MSALGWADARICGQMPSQLGVADRERLQLGKTALLRVISRPPTALLKLGLEEVSLF